MNGRIKSIADAATYLFLQQGYSKTQISHIAKAVGVSVGTIYLDFTGKKEILHFILKCTLEPDFINRNFDRPITDNLFAGLENDIVSMFEKITLWKRLSQTRLICFLNMPWAVCSSRRTNLTFHF